MLGYDEKSEMWRIDVSKALKHCPDIAGRLEDMQDDLANPDFVNAICLHEAAHEVYWKRIGIHTLPDYTPRIEYDGKKNRCIHIYAAVRIVNGSSLTNQEITVRSLAQAHASGGVAVEVFMPSREYHGGDESDYENFVGDLAFGELSRPINLLEEWNSARELTRCELLDPSLTMREELLRRSNAFESAFRGQSELV